MNNSEDVSVPEEAGESCESSEKANIDLQQLMPATSAFHEQDDWSISKRQSLKSTKKSTHRRTLGDFPYSSSVTSPVRSKSPRGGSNLAEVVVNETVDRILESTGRLLDSK